MLFHPHLDKKASIDLPWQYHEPSWTLQLDNLSLLHFKENIPNLFNLSSYDNIEDFPVTIGPWTHQGCWKKNLLSIYINKSPSNTCSIIKCLIWKVMSMKPGFKIKVNTIYIFESGLWNRLKDHPTLTPDNRNLSTPTPKKFFP